MIDNPVKAARLAARLQQQEVAQMARVSIASMSKMETGKPVSKKIAERVLIVLGLSLETTPVAILPPVKRIVGIRRNK